MKTLSKYELLAELGRGGMGVVYLALQRGGGVHDKLHVVKTLREDVPQNENAVAMFQEEARLAGRLSHPSIVHTHEVGTTAEGRHFMVMDYLDGVSFARARRADVGLSLSAKIRVLCEVLDALHYAHTLVTPDGQPAAVVHRDVTPANVFLTFEGDVKLLDFGVAKAMTDSHLETRAGTLKGKPGFMAPEQIAGRSTPQVDIFAVGVMLWECIAGKRMWGSKTEIEVIAHLVRGDLPRLDESVADVAPELLRIVERATAAAPENRYRTADEFLVDLSSFSSVHSSGARERTSLARKLNEAFSAERSVRAAAIAAAMGRSEQEAGELVPPMPLLMPLREPASHPSHPSRASHPSRPSHRPSRASGSGVSSTRFAAYLPPAIPPARSLLPFLAFGTVVVVSIAAVVIVVVLNQRRIPEVPVAALPSREADDKPPVRAAAVPASSYRYGVSVSPPSASVIANGVARTNPFVDQCAAGTTITLHLHARGFESQTRDIACERDESLDIALIRSPKESGPTSPQRGPAAPAKRAASPEAASPDDTNSLGGASLRVPKAPKAQTPLDPITPEDLKTR